MRWIAPAVVAAIQIGAMLRYYRRFVFDEPTGRVWGLADDVYISACFGRSLFEGHGFVWYAGAPKVEGISNPLWSFAIGGLHVLPGFSADRLGAFVLGLNALLLVAFAFAFCRALERAVPQPSAASVVFGLLLVPSSTGLAYWSAEGFEIPLLGALCFAMLYVAQGSNLRRAAFWLGGLFVAGLATRMDFALLAAPALGVYAWRRPGLRSLAVVIGVTLLGAAVLLIARVAYYGDWLPNTYYLKTTGWPLEARIGRGFEQNRGVLRSAGLALAVALGALAWTALPSLRGRAFGVRATAFAARDEHASGPRAGAFPAIDARAVGLRAASFAAIGFALTVAYSTWVGGDAWRTFGGYDRHTAVGGALWVWAAWTAIAALGPRWVPSALACAVCLPIAFFPVWSDDRAARVIEGVWSDHVPARTLERDWIRYGKAFREISEPGMRIAVCPAGAIIYFSERGGVDLLGKVDPFVARLPVSTRKPPHNACWRNAPGHNKEDDEAMFELRKPEYSRYRPPPSAAGVYVKQKHAGHHFFRRTAP